MHMGVVGLGRMGASMIRRLMRGGHECVVYDVNADASHASCRKAPAARRLSMPSPRR
jgi:6-phosphogluconate dehydrogenase